MLVDDHIREMIEKFYACTHLPIRSVDFEGIPFHSAGYTREWEELFESRDIFDQAKKKLLAQQTRSVITISGWDQIQFTACQICGKNITRGFHFIGPYTCQRGKASGAVVYKPADCIPYLLELLRTIGLDSSYMKEKIKTFYDLPYSLYVKRAIDHMDARYREAISLEDTARFLKISKSYLCHLFKKETGKTFSQFLNELRIEKSKKMLLEENLPVLDIALAVGFNNQTYYNLVFKKVMRRTPLEFRKNRSSFTRSQKR